MLKKSNNMIQFAQAKHIQKQSFNQKKQCKIQNQLYYQKIFPITNIIQLDKLFKRHSTQMKNTPHFKITQDHKNYIKIQFKRYLSFDENLLYFNQISQAQKLEIISSIFCTYVDLMQLYGIFCLDKKALKIDETGKFIIWVYADYQKCAAQKQQFYGRIDTRKTFTFRQNEATKSFLYIFGQFLNHKKINSNSQLTIKQSYQVLNQIKKKNQLITKCPAFIKNKSKTNLVLQQPLFKKNVNARVSNQQFIAASTKESICSKKFVVESLGNLEQRNKSKSKVKKLLSYNKDSAQPKINVKNAQQNVSLQNISNKCRISTKDFYAVDSYLNKAKKSKRTFSDLQPCFSFKKALQFKQKQDIVKGTHKRTNTDIKTSFLLFKKYIPHQKFHHQINTNKQRPVKQQKFFRKEQNNQKITKQSPKRQYFSKLNHNITLKQKQNQLKGIQKKNLTKKFPQSQKISFGKNKRLQNLHTEYVCLNQNQKQFNEYHLQSLSKSMVKCSSTKQLTLKIYKYKEAPQQFNKIQSCSNLSTFFMKQFQNSTSTAPTLKNCRSNELFFISSLNPFQQLKLQQQLNQMFSSRTRNGSIHIIDQQKYEDLKCQVYELLDM